MPVLLVTVVGPAGAVDLAVPAGPPVRDLLGPLTRVVGGAVDGKDTCGEPFLALPGGDPLPPDRSLVASGVADGDVLVVGAGPPAAPALAFQCPKLIAQINALASRFRVPYTAGDELTVRLVKEGREALLPRIVDMC